METEELKSITALRELTAQCANVKNTLIQERSTLRTTCGDVFSELYLDFVVELAEMSRKSFAEILDRLEIVNTSNSQTYLKASPVYPLRE